MFLTGLDRVLRDSGVSWSARPGWRTRTAHRGGLREVRAVMWHTTETVSSAFRNSAAPTLGYVTSRAGQDWPLYNILIGRSGHAYLIAAGTAAHAGKGSGHGMPRDQANYYSFGISFDSNNNTTPVNAAQLETGARLGAAIDREWKSSISHVMHGEWAPARRSDPTKIPGGWGALRSAINRGYWRNAPTTPSTPEPPKEPVMSASDIWNAREPAEPTVQRRFPGIREDGYRMKTWVQYTYNWARRAVEDLPGVIWNRRIKAENSVANRYSIREDGYRASTWVQYAYLQARWAREQAQENAVVLQAIAASLKDVADGNGDHIYDAVAEAIAEHDKRRVQVDVRIAEDEADDPDDPEALAALAAADEEDQDD